MTPVDLDTSPGYALLDVGSATLRVDYELDKSDHPPSRGVALGSFEVLGAGDTYELIETDRAIAALGGLEALNDLRESILEAIDEAAEIVAGGG